MSPSPVVLDPAWKKLYSAALLENDRSRIPGRIAEAEKEIVKRVRNLFQSPEHSTLETDALEEALRMLQALKECLEIPKRMAA
jgi:hypothetical protein